MKTWTASRLCLVAIAVLASACAANVEQPSPITEPFGATLVPTTRIGHPFRVTRSGPVTINFTQIGTGNEIIGVRLDGGTATPVFENDLVIGTTTLNVTLDPATYVLTVFDPGQLTGPIAYSGTITHF